MTIRRSVVPHQWPLAALLAAAPLALTVAAPATLAQEQQEVAPDKVKALIKTAEEVAKQVEELRAMKFKTPVEKGVYTTEQLRKYIEKKLFEEELGGGELERQQWMLSSLGFLPAGTDLKKTIIDVLLSQIGGFYDLEQNAFFMLERAADYGDYVNRTLIAHELTHALDDQHFDLHPKMRARQDEHDASFAIGAVIEGSATALMTRWGPKYGGAFDRAELADAMRAEQEKAKVLLEAPPYFSTIVARYMAGMSFLTRGRGALALVQMEAGVRDEVAQALRDVPLSSEQILHPEKYWDPAKRDDPVKLANDDAFAKSLEKKLGIEIVDRETLGEIHMALLARSPTRKLNLMLMMNPRVWTNRGATGWGGDRLYLARKEAMGDGAGDARGIVWFTWWDTAKDKDEFVAAYSEHHADRVRYAVAERGNAAVFVYDALASEATARAALELMLAEGELRKGTTAFNAVPAQPGK